MESERKQKIGLKLEEIREILDAEIIVEADDWHDILISSACGSDLMSDVLLFVKPDCLLLTGLTSSQVVKTAAIAEVRVLCFVRGKKPDEEILEAARKKGIPVLATKLPLFESCGRLYFQGLCGTSEIGG